MSRCRALIASALLLSLNLSAVAQQEVPPDVKLPYVLDTGWVANAGSEPMIVATFEVHVEGVSSLRLYFEQMALAGDPLAGEGSQVQITSLLDGAVQVLDARTAAQWKKSTAYFNGDTVVVDLLAQPGAGRNRLQLASVDVGAPAISDSQCGSVDDRVPSSDARVGRLMPVGCTAWMIDDCSHCFLSAGHCVGSIDVVEFNVPFSSGSGSLVHPSPQHQYSVDDSSIQSNGGQGTGNDFAYFGCFPNTQTGLSPGQAQGSWFELVAPPPAAGNTIRVTGYGTDSSPNSTFNQIQQTHSGPFWAISGTNLEYQVDTTGGNSGSPVIWDNTNQAIGIHTHGGCGSFSGNHGTSSLHAGLQSALANAKGVCKPDCAWSDLGQPLAGSVGLPHLTGQGGPTPGAQILLVGSGMKLFGTTNLVVGFGLANAPYKGGTMVPAPDVVLPLTLALGSSIFQFAFPAGVPSGAVLVFQHWVQDPGVALGWSATNAMQLTVP